MNIVKLALLVLGGAVLGVGGTLAAQRRRSNAQEKAKEPQPAKETPTTE
jgi:hypothetical protein